MRKNEKKMNKAIRSRENFKLDNTEVWISNGGVAHVYLHDNLIASFTPTDMTFYSDCVSCETWNEKKMKYETWKTRTTKSRLNAMLSEFHNELSIFQRKGEWYVNTPYGWIAWDSHSLRVSNYPSAGRTLHYYDTQAGRYFFQNISTAA